MDPLSIANLGIGVATGIGGIFGGNQAAASAKKKADKNAQKTQKSNKRLERHNWRQTKRKYEYDKETLEILKRNTEANLQFQDDSRLQEWEYGMGIRDYRFSQENRAYDESVNRATKQKSFNELAEEQALIEQDRYLQENLIGLGFSEQQMMLDFAAANAGLELKKSQAQVKAGVTQAQLTGGASFAKMRKQAEAGVTQAQLTGGASFAKMSKQAEAGSLKQRLGAETELSIRKARTDTVLERQQGRIEALKATGAALAAGQAGRSARKVAQGIAAEAGAREAAGTEQFLLTEEAALQKQFFDVMGIDQQLLLNTMGIDQKLMFDQQNVSQQLLLDTIGINQKLMFDQQNVVQELLFTEQGIDLDLNKLNNQLNLDKAQIAVSRDNLQVSDTNVRRKINLQRQQADIEAEAKIRLKPEIAPPLPKPMTLPRPEWQDVFKPKRGPEPIKGASYTPPSTFGNTIQNIGNIAGSVIQSGVFDNFFNGGGNNFGGGGGNTFSGMNYSDFAGSLNSNPFASI